LDSSGAADDRRRGRVRVVIVARRRGVHAGWRTRAGRSSPCMRWRSAPR
jgi:hypothetical protein